MSFDMYMFAISAGMLAGEGLGGVLQALLAIVKADGSRTCPLLPSPSNYGCSPSFFVCSLRNRDRLPWSRVLRVNAHP